MIERASPIQQRKALEMAHTYVKAGIGFVPVPVANIEEFDKLMRQAIDRLADMERRAVAAGEKGGDRA